MSVNGRSEPDIDPVMAAAFLAVIFGMGVLLLGLVEWPVFVWSLIHLRPMLLDPASAIGGALHNVFAADHFDYPPAWWAVAGKLPPPAAWVVLDLTGAVMFAFVAAAVVVRLDRWRGRSSYGLRSWDPRARLKRRAWATPRNLLHLQRPELPSVRDVGLLGYLRAVKNRVMRLLAGEQEMPAPAGGDSWWMGFIHGTPLRSGPGQHALGVAPSGSGKTRRLVARAVAEHGGPLVVLSNKLDVFQLTAAARQRRGPVWIYAPTFELDPAHPSVVRWTPLAGCTDWGVRVAHGPLDL